MANSTLMVSNPRCCSLSFLHCNVAAVVVGVRFFASYETQQWCIIIIIIIIILVSFSLRRNHLLPIQRGNGEHKRSRSMEHYSEK